MLDFDKNLGCPDYPKRCKLCGYKNKYETKWCELLWEDYEADEEESEDEDKSGKN
jgi:hypothetical protein